MLYPPPAGTLAQPAEQVERYRWLKLTPVKFTVGQELEKVPEVVAVGDRGVRATTSVNHVAKKSAR